VRAGTSSDRRTAVETSTLVALEPGVYRARVRFDLREPLTASGTRYDAGTWERDFDCTRRRVMVRNVVLYFQGREVLDVGDTDGWAPAGAGTGEGKELEFVCRLAAELGR
jgi:hypothetical protein